MKSRNQIAWIDVRAYRQHHLHLQKFTNRPENRAVYIFQAVDKRSQGWFYVLQGQITAKIGDRQVVLDAGGSGYASRGTVHAFQNFGDATAQMLVMVTPGGFNQFFEDLSSLKGDCLLRISFEPNNS